MPKPSTTHASLVLIWLLHSGLVLLLAYINPNHYTTADSQYYLESARNLLSGHGYTIFEENQYHWNGTFPMGYSLAISVISFLTRTEVLWASKIVNITSCGIWLFFLRQWFGKRQSVFFACILFLGSFVKLWAHTWSEPLFLVILFSWVYHFNHLNKAPFGLGTKALYILILGFLLMLVRYAGMFIIPLTLGFAVFWMYKKDRSKGLLYGSLSLCWSIFLLCYLDINEHQSGQWFGGARFQGQVSIPETVLLFGKGLLNEIFLIRDTAFQSIDLLFLAGITFQILMTVVLIKPLTRNTALSTGTATFWITAFAYLAFLFTLRVFSPFDEPGYRLLSPFTFLVLCGLLHAISGKKITDPLKYLLIAFVIFSWMEVIPNDGLGKKLKISLKNAIQEGSGMDDLSWVDTTLFHP